MSTHYFIEGLGWNEKGEFVGHPLDKLHLEHDKPQPGDSIVVGKFITSHYREMFKTIDTESLEVTEERKM